MAEREPQEQLSTVRIPLYMYEGQRQQNPVSNDSRYQGDQFIVNAYPVIRKDPLRSDSPMIVLQQRLGWDNAATNVDLTNGEGGATTAIISNTSSAFVKAVMSMRALNDVTIVVYVDGTNFKFAQYRHTTGTCRYLGVVAMGSNYGATTTNIHLSELTIGGSNTPYCGVVLSDETTNVSKAYYIASSGGVMTYNGLTPISDTSFPTELGASAKLIVGPLVQLNENIYIMTKDGIIYNSELDGNGDSQIVNWDASGTVDAQSYADRGMGLIRYKHHLIAFGQETIEFYNDEGIAAPASPLAPTQQAFIKMGTISQKSFISVDDTIWWVSTSASGQLALYKLDGYTPVKVSEPTMSRIAVDRPYNIDLQVTSMHGMKHLIFNTRVIATRWFDDGVNNGDTLNVSGLNAAMYCNLCYCIDTNAWWGWASEHDYQDYGGRAIEQLYFSIQYESYSTIKRMCWSTAGEGISGFTYGLHPRYHFPYSESSLAEGYHDAYNLNNDTAVDSYRIPVSIVTNYFDFGNDKRKFLRSIRLIGDHIYPYNGSGAPWDAFEADGLTLTLGVTKSDDFGNNSAPEIIRSKALLTQTEHRYNFNNFGAFRKIRFFILINTFVPLRLEALELTIAQGTH